jgi:hypothetical protein
MSNLRRTAMGSAVDIDQLRLANETTIAIGNAKTNARGDLLGAGGKVIKTRAQVMQEYHQMNMKPAIAAVEDDYNDSHEYAGQSSQVITQPKSNVLQKAVQESPATPEPVSYSKPRGSFAESLAKEAEVTQELVEPTGLVGGGGSAPTGVQRI